MAEIARGVDKVEGDGNVSIGCVVLCFRLRDFGA